MQALRESCEDTVCCSQERLNPKFDNSGRVINSGDLKKCDIAAKKSCMQDAAMQKQITKCCLDQCPVKVPCSERICGTASQSGALYGDCLRNACGEITDPIKKSECLKSYAELCKKTASDDCMQKYGDRIRECEVKFNKDYDPCIEACNTQLNYGAGVLEAFTMGRDLKLFYLAVGIYVAYVVKRRFYK